LKLGEFNTLFLIVGIMLALIAASPALSLISIPTGEERFSELWILGLEHTADNFPFNVSANEEYNIYVGVGNQLGESAYYTVYVKLGNQTHQLPNSTTAEPSPLPPLHEFRFVLSDGKVWETPLAFATDYVLLQQNDTVNTVTVNTISINGKTFPVNCTSTWDPDGDGFYFQMVFELWYYDNASSVFQYHNQYTNLWLNMTGAQPID
jgi:hypothetical protein